MSIHLMTLAWQTALPLNQKAALLALADWANDRGGSIHPSIYTISERLTCSERTAQRLLKELVEQGWLAVVGNPFGGAPGATRRYCINVAKLREQAALEESRRPAERAMMRQRYDEDDAEFGPFETGDKLTGVETGDKLARVTNQVETGDKSGRGGVTNQVETGDTRVTLSTIEPLVEPPKNHLPAPPAAAPAAKLAVVSTKTPKAEMTPEETAHQAACRATWGAYCDAYLKRYGVGPVRNQQANAQVKQLVLRLGQEESPGVARFYVERVSERYIVQSLHPLGMLLKQAESFRTQWVKNQTMTSTKAMQVDQTASNFDAVDEAMAIMAERDAQRGGGYGGR